jgi:hypothetical protein
VTVNVKPTARPALPRKPMARALRVTLFEREIKERLSGAAVEILLDRAQVLSEGRRSAAATGGAMFYGSTMLTIDLASAGEQVRESCDPRTCRRVAALVESDPRVQRRVRQIAAREAERLAGTPLGSRVAEVRVRAQGTLLYIDVDVEGSPAA